MKLPISSDVRRWNRGWARVLAMAVVTFLGACSQPDGGMQSQDFGPDADADGHVRATEATALMNSAVEASLPIDDPTDFEDARRGFMAADEPLVIPDPISGGDLDMTAAYAFLEHACPPSVNPSLWRQAQLNAIRGLFKVTDGIYQVRGYDLANMTIIEGDTGRIVIDPLTTMETAGLAMRLVERELGKRPIVAVLFTHSHIDHFAGVKAVISESDVQSGKVRVIAPLGFLHEAVSENVLAGTVMSRRAQYMFGMPLAHSPRGHVDSGLGKQTLLGTYSLIAPTETIDHTGQTLDIDGIRFEFQYTPESEAPAEMAFYLPEAQAYCGAEIVSRNMHNIYTLRGAKARDALKWSNYIDEAAQLYGDKAELLFNSHHWPVFGQEAVRKYLHQQRDTYKFIHDQTLRLASQGMTPREIAEAIELPSTLREVFANRGYYGTIEHNAKAVYQFYFGWYDGNPANLNPLPPEDAAKRYVDAIGGLAALMTQAQEAYDSGEYRWAATLLNHAVFAEPDEDAARGLLAQTYDQLGYQAESGPWRDEYLTAARELRHGIVSIDSRAGADDILRAIPLDLFFQAMATGIDAEKADGKEFLINFIFSDADETFVLEVVNAVLHHRAAPPSPDAQATVTLSREFWLRLLKKEAGALDMLTSDDFNISGDRLAVASFFRLLDPPEADFPIVTP